jgi:enterochelin esterase-like enzyme
MRTGVPVLAAALLGVVVLVAAGAAAAGRSSSAVGLPPTWVQVQTGPDGGSVWSGRIPNSFAPSDSRLSSVYLPPGYSPAERYPVLYLLHGLVGNPSEYWDSLHLARRLDAMIGSGSPPFIVVTPVGGQVVDPNSGEWAGIWESYVVGDVVPWVDTHLATVASPHGRVLEGLCAGGFGAVDIGLRHPGVFSALGSWEGYFTPFRDGPFAHAGTKVLAAHNPALLVRQEAPLLRRDHVRFYVSAGGNHGHILRSWSIAFAQELARLRLTHELWLMPLRDKGHFWSATLPTALQFAASSFRA